MYITVCYDKAQTMLGLFIYFKYLPVDLQWSALICAIIILVVLSVIFYQIKHIVLTTKTIIIFFNQKQENALQYETKSLQLLRQLTY